MTFRLGTNERPFKRAMIWSAGFHVVLLVLIIVNPSLPKPRKANQVYYINFGGGGGGNGGSGGGGGGITAVKPAEEKISPTEVKPQLLRDLTALQKVQPDQPASNLRFPVDKPKREAKPKPDKKTEISKVDPAAAKAAADKAAAAPKTAASASQGGAAGAKGATTAAPQGGGSGLTIGGGKPGFGEGGGGGGGIGGLSDQIGNSDFPYMYYLTEIRDRISGNWEQSLIDPGISGTFQVAVYFKIFKNGSISGVDIRESSGIKTLDQSAVRAVMRSANFPPLPDGYNEEYLGIILIFEHSR